LLRRRAPISTLFPYTTLFRSPVLVARLDRFAHALAGRLVAFAVGLAGGEVDECGGAAPQRGAAHLLGRAAETGRLARLVRRDVPDRKSTRLNSSHLVISYAVF